MIDNLKSLIEWIKQQQKTFIIYLVAFTLLFLGVFISALTGIPYDIFTTLSIVLFVIGFVWDSIAFISKNYDNLNGKSLATPLPFNLHFYDIITKSKEKYHANKTKNRYSRLSSYHKPWCR